MRIRYGVALRLGLTQARCVFLREFARAANCLFVLVLRIRREVLQGSSSEAESACPLARTLTGDGDASHVAPRRSSADSEAVTAVPRAGRSTLRLPGGSMIGRFRVLEVLGQGGAGVVCTAHDDVLDRRVAIKVLDPCLAGRDERHRARLLREARTMARLAHPNIVPVFEAGISAEGHVYVVMERIEGGTLRSWLADQPRTWREIARMMRAAGEGLAAAHEAGVVHRDFKLDNVLVGADGRPRVTDFGIARDAVNAGAKLTLAGEVLGTPGYMAPEQLWGDGIDARTDVFGFCVALYRAFYGRLPFDPYDLELDDAARAAAVRVRPKGTSLPPRLHRVMAAGLAADPAERPELSAVLAELDCRPLRRRPALLSAAAAVIGVAIATGGSLGAHFASGAAPPPNPPVASLPAGPTAPERTVFSYAASAGANNPTVAIRVTAPTVLPTLPGTSRAARPAPAGARALPTLPPAPPTPSASSDKSDKSSIF